MLILWLATGHFPDKKGKTRLISIVSKRQNQLNCVVFIVIFMLRLKNVGLKKMCVPKTICVKKIFESQKILDKKNSGSRKFFVKKNFGFQKIWSKNFFGKKKLGSSKIFVPKELWVPKSFCKIFAKHLLSPKNSGF